LERIEREKLDLERENLRNRQRQQEIEKEREMVGVIAFNDILYLIFLMYGMYKVIESPLVSLAPNFTLDRSASE